MMFSLAVVRIYKLDGSFVTFTEGCACVVSAFSVLTSSLLVIASLYIVCYQSCVPVIESPLCTSHSHHFMSVTTTASPHVSVCMHTLVYQSLRHFVCTSQCIVLCTGVRRYTAVVNWLSQMSFDSRLTSEV